MNHTFQDLKNILESLSFKRDIEINAIPEEEIKIFLSAMQNSSEILKKLDLSHNLDKNELKKWQFAYLKLHDLFHQEINDDDIVKLELKTTAPIFANPSLFNQEDFEKLILSYFILGVSALKNSHSSLYIISEKIILGEFISVGGCEKGIWGIKCKHNIFTEVAKNLLGKVERDRHQHLVKKYKDFVFDFL